MKSILNPTYDEIAVRARDLWLSHGSPQGRDEEFWLEAERQLKAGMPVAKPEGSTVAASTTTTATTTPISTPTPTPSRSATRSGSRRGGSTKFRDADSLREKTEAMLSDVNDTGVRSPTSLDLTHNKTERIPTPKSEEP